MSVTFSSIGFVIFPIAVIVDPFDALYFGISPRERFCRRRYKPLLQCPLNQMAPHLSPVELNLIMECPGRRQSLKDIHEVIKSEREAGGIEPPKIWAIRRVCRGATHRRGRAETRGGKCKLNEAQVRRLNSTRIRLLKKAKVQYEVPYCLAAGGPDPDGNLKLVAPEVVPRAW